MTQASVNFKAPQVIPRYRWGWGPFCERKVPEQQLCRRPNEQPVQVKAEVLQKGGFQEGKKTEIDRLSHRNKMENCVEICIRDTCWNSQKIWRAVRCSEETKQMLKTQFLRSRKRKKMQSILTGLAVRKELCSHSKRKHEILNFRRMEGKE